MIYNSLEYAKSDLNWLLISSTIIDEHTKSLSSKQVNEYVEKLQYHNDAFIKEFYGNLCEALNFKPLEFTHEINKEFLPLLALVPSMGLVLVYEKSSDGSYKAQSKNGLESIAFFPQGTFFAPLKSQKQVSQYKSSYAMFKQVALKHKKVLVYLAAATFSINTLALGTSLYTMQVYDRVVPTGAISTLIALTIGVFIAMMLEMIIKFSRSTIQDYATKAMDVEYSYDIFNRFLKLRCDAMPKSIGTLTGQLQSYNSVRHFISSAAMFVLIDLPFSLIFVVVIFVIGGFYMGLIPIVFFAITIAIGFAFRGKIEEASQNSSMASYKKTGLMVETVENSENIKATGAGFNILNKWNSLTHSAMDDDITIKHYSDMSTFITQFLQQFSYISIVCIGAYFVTQEGTLTMGSLIAMTILSGRILQPIAQLPNHFVQWGKAKLAVKDLDNIYQLPTDNEGVERPLNPHLHTKDLLCSDVEFGYSENQSVVKLANLSIKQGEKVAILGVIGSGKSTLLKLLAGLYRPRNGFVYLNGLDTQLLKRDLLNDTVGYLPQNTKLFAGTLRDNLTFGMIGIDDEKIIEASQLTGLITLINALPNGLDTAVPEGGESVSGGQKQLIALTRLLIANRDIWLLDEPTASMDEGTEKQMIAMLKQKLSQEQTMIVVTHKPIVLNMVDRIIVLTPKGIAMDGTKEEVLNQLAQNAAKKVVR